MIWILLFTSTLWAGQDCIDCSVPQSPPATPPAPITYAENKNCRPIEVGQGRLSDQVAVEDTNSIPANREYLLYRRSEKKFEVIYQLDFKPIVGADAPATMSGADMAERARQCLAMLPPARLSDGRELTFRFITPEQRNLIIGKAPPKITINVVKASRGNAENFAEDFRCGQVIHELLHKVGLCDEYHETGGAANVGKCRPQAQGSSVMGNGMHQAYDDAAGEPFSCNLASQPDTLSYLNDPTSTHKELLMKRHFRHIGNRPWNAFGHQNPPAGSPKSVCCKLLGPQTQLPTLPSNSSPRVSLIENSAESLRFKNTEAFLMHNSITKKYNLSLQEQNYECKIADVAVEHQPACREYLELIRPELESVADPNRTMYTCPVDLPGPPINFDIGPGEIELSGQTLQLRNKGNGRSILHSGHFERILAGECSSPATQVYDRCSRFAYEHNYTNAQKAMSCEELLPAECKRVDWIGTLTQ